MLNKLHQNSKSTMVPTFSESEIETALKSMESAKAPGPDGMNAGILKILWPQIKFDILKFFDDFHREGKFPREINSSFIVLVPKSSSAASPSDYRPISLMNISLKLLTKVMATRLQGVIRDLVSQTQSAFIRKRQMTDCILVTSEVFSSLKAKKGKGVIMKLDFAKAFDTVSWEFVLQILRRMNFDSKWIL